MKNVIYPVWPEYRKPAEDRQIFEIQDARDRQCLDVFNRAYIDFLLGFTEGDDATMCAL